MTESKNSPQVTYSKNLIPPSVLNSSNDVFPINNDQSAYSSYQDAAVQDESTPSSSQDVASYPKDSIAPASSISPVPFSETIKVVICGASECK
jgi:hypothetical protein